MKKTMLKLMMLTLLGVFLMGAASSAEAAGRKMDLGIGGHIGLGGTTDEQFAFALTPYLSFSPIDNLSVFGRLPFYEGLFTGPVDIHLFPFLFGARYHFQVMDKLRVYPGMALGFTIIHTAAIKAGGFTIAGANDAVRFSLNFQGGVEYEVIPNLGLDASFDIYLINVEKNANARFGVTLGAIYYLPI